MRFFASAFTAVTTLTLACLVTATHAQTPPAPAADAPAQPGMLSRIGNWFEQDWDNGWQTGSTWRVMASPYTYHYSRDPDHTNVYMIGLERQRADGFLVGGTYFRNSFGQPSGYAYIGQRWDKLAGVDALFGQLTGGVLYGYKPPYNHKVPLNYKGFSPGVVPSVGWQFTPALAGQLVFLGNSALMFQVSAEFR